MTADAPFVAAIPIAGAADDHPPEEVTDPSKQNADASKHRLYMGIGGCLAVVIAVVVVVAVVVAGGGGDGDSSDDPSPIVPETPAPAPPPQESTPWDECFSSSMGLLNPMRARRDYSVFVDAQFCPRSEIQVWPDRYEVHEDIAVQPDSISPQVLAGTRPGIFAQSNMRVKCGPNGDLRDRCVVNTYSGEFLVRNDFYAFLEPAATNVTYEGITFRGHQSMLEMVNGGDITFKNCLFRNSVDFTPFTINHRPRKDHPTIRQTVTFDGCIFEDIDFGHIQDTRIAENFTDVATMFVVTQPANTLIIRDSVFRNNHRVDQTPSTVIASMGGEVQVEQTCFTDNTATIGPILLGDNYGTPTLSTNNIFVSGASTSTCDLVAERDVVDGTITCQAGTADATECSSSQAAFDPFW